MSRITDEELRRQLNRRTDAALGDVEREELLEFVGHASRTPVAAQPWWFKSARWLAPAAVLVVLALVVAPLAFPAGPRPTSPSTLDAPGGSLAPTAASVPSLIPEPTDTPTPLPPVLTAEQLVEMSRRPASEGTVVLAQARLDAEALAAQHRRGPRCVPGEPCVAALLADVSPPIDVWAGWRDAPERDGTQFDVAGTIHWRVPLTIPTEAGLFAFRVLSNHVEYLGPAQVDGDKIVWTVSAVQSGRHADPSDDLFAVKGWLVATSPVPCPGPPDPGADIGYYCGRSWLTQEQTYTVENGSYHLVLDGLHVQWDAYDDFAQGPVVDGPRGAEPRLGTYLVRSVGCPPVVMGDCPVWSIVGRLDNYPPPAASETPFPSEIAGEHVLTAEEAPSYVAASVSAEPFLVGGYVWFVEADCVGRPPDFPRTPLLAECDDGVRLSSTPGDSWGSFRLVLLEDVGLRATQGRLVVLRVHAHDPLATECPEKYRTRCAQAIVVDEVVWPVLASTPEPVPTAVDLDVPTLAVGNWTTLRVFIYVNGMDAAILEPGQGVDPIDPGMLRPLPWHVEATTSSGRVLLTLDVHDGDVWHSGPDPSGASTVHGVGARTELSCGRIDIWSGPPLAGPPPPSSFRPGDCDS